MTAAQNVKITKVATGEFSVTVDGKKTDLEITNGSAGVSGYGNNTYLLIKKGKITVAGTLQMMKKIVIKAASKGEITVIENTSAIEWEADDSDWKAADAALIKKSGKPVNLCFKRS